MGGRADTPEPHSAARAATHCAGTLNISHHAHRRKPTGHTSGTLPPSAGGTLHSHPPRAPAPPLLTQPHHLEEPQPPTWRTQRARLHPLAPKLRGTRAPPPPRQRPLAPATTPAVSRLPPARPSGPRSSAKPGALLAPAGRPAPALPPGAATTRSGPRPDSAACAAGAFSRRLPARPLPPPGLAGSLAPSRFGKAASGRAGAAGAGRGGGG